jgi:hypothetical protein
MRIAGRWRLIRKIQWGRAWNCSLAGAFPSGSGLFALLVSPVSVPLLFALHVYQSYLLAEILDELRRIRAIRSRVRETHSDT